MTIILNFLGILASLLLSFISSGMETALYRVSRVRLRIASDGGRERATQALGVLKRLDAMVTTILIDNNIAAYAGTYFLNLQFTVWAVPHSELVTTAVITPLFFILTESLPKQLAYTDAERWTLSLVRVFTVFRFVLHPFVWILNTASAGLRKLLRVHGGENIGPSHRALLIEHLNAGVAERIISEEQSRMATRIMKLHGVGAGDCMIPLAKLALVPVSSTRAHALSVMAHKRTQLVLLADRSGNPTGQVVTLNTLVLNPGEDSEPILRLAETPAGIRSADTVPEVLNLFHSRHARTALVTRRNRVIGLINTRSVLDRIAGISR